MESIAPSELVIEDTRESDDGTVAFSARYADGAPCEFVLLQNARGEYSACLSSQSGCAERCPFCATGAAGLRRSLSAAEILAQLTHTLGEAKRRSCEVNGRGKPVLNSALFMGMGEPTRNLDAVSAAVEAMADPRFEPCGGLLAIARRRITISTIAPSGALTRLAAAELKTGLAISLGSAVDDTRRRLLPGSADLDEVRSALERNFPSRRVILALTLIAGVNDAQRDSEALVEWITAKPRLKVIVNLIAWNSFPGAPFKAPTRDAIERFSQPLLCASIPTTIRYPRGDAIDAACGQLTFSESRRSNRGTSSATGR